MVACVNVSLLTERGRVGMLAARSTLSSRPTVPWHPAV